MYIIMFSSLCPLSRWYLFIIRYGQTNSGKTYTIFGEPAKSVVGLVDYALRYVMMHSLQVCVLLVETPIPDELLSACMAFHRLR